LENNQITQDEEMNDNTENVAQTVGHNMYILAYQVCIDIEIKLFF
jgi:hypothetical protein